MSRKKRLSEAQEELGELQAELVELARPERTTGGLEVAHLLEAWGFVRGARLNSADPEQAVFYIHPTLPHLHMTIPIGSPLCHYVVDYAAQLIRSVEAADTPPESSD